jgi:galactitol-specific phosphotransferase system IIC component
VPDQLRVLLFVVAFVVIGFFGIRQSLAAHRDVQAAEPDINSKVIKVGGPVFVAAALGIVLAGVGDQTGNTVLMVCGLAMFAAAAVVWVPFVVKRLRHVQKRR